MNNTLKPFSLFLSEAKQVGTLYHFTNIEWLVSILEMNTLLGSWGKISLTRDKNFHARVTATGVSTEARITIDGEKLSHKYKIQPFHDLKYFFQRTAQQGIDEMEETVLTKHIPNIRNYITEIKFMLPESKLKDESYNECFPRYFSRIKELCKEMSIPLFNSLGEEI